jgi:ABC-type lipoprotein export system ATPase subunit
MNITFEHVLPQPLIDLTHPEWSFWSHGNINLKGENTFISAKSGKGKSTFLQMIFGLRKDYNGNILFNGSNINDLSFDEWSEIRQSKLSMVFQDLRLFEQLTVWDNIKLKNDLGNIFSETELLTFADNIGIKKQWNQITGTLSMGQKQRVAILRALCQPFEYLLLDEPFAHLDKSTARSCFELIQDKASLQNAGIVLSGLEHNEQSGFTQNIVI